jgi:hypothetical protein
MIQYNSNNIASNKNNFNQNKMIVKDQGKNNQKIISVN